MNLAVFDIDDTLTRTMAVDTECFVQAVEDLLDFEVAGMSWGDFPHVTDTAVLNVIYQRHLSRLPTRSETASFIDHLFGLLKERHRLDASRFRPVAGAEALLSNLGKREDWSFAMATGAWHRTAVFKLEAAGLFQEPTALATSDDSHTRTGIFNTAVERAKSQNGTHRFDRIVSVGDGAWDVSTARQLGVAFIGVGAKGHLDQIGASVGVEDYRDLQTVYDLLDSAPIP